MRPTVAEIDLGAIRHNVAAFMALIGPSEVCAVVKADGYGHGDVPVASAALDAGATRLAVALVEEGVRLREAGIGAPIILLSEPPVGSLPDVVEYRLEPTVYTSQLIQALGETDGSSLVHVKVDTGMHRVGADPSEVGALLRRIDQTANLELGSLWTHFAVSDSDPAYTRHQIEAFDAVADHAGAPVEHLANTAGAVLFPDARRSLCRIGLGIYGLHPCDETRDVIDLKPAMRVISKVTHVRRLPAGERPSYGRVRPLRSDSTVVTIPVGYADGFARALTATGGVTINGQTHPLAGTVTMDQIVVDVGDADVAVGDEVVLLGSSPDSERSADDWAGDLGTISYEVVCSIGPRVPRRYS